MRGMDADGVKGRLKRVRQARFLEVLSQTGVIRPAAEAAGVPRSTVNHWREDDEDFAQEFSDAMENSVDVAELELRTRAVDGVDEPVMHNGEPVWRRDPRTGDLELDDDFNPVPYTVPRRSDRLLEVYAKANRKKYRDKGSLEVSGPDGGAIPTALTVSYVLPEGKDETDYTEDDDAWLR